MAEFTAEVDIYPSEFVDSCNKQEIKSLIKYLVQEGHLPETVLSFEVVDGKTSESDFIEKLEQLKGKFYSLSPKEELMINNVFKRLL